MALSTAAVSQDGQGGGLRSGARPRVSGKFLWVGERKLHVRGVTYGTFAPDADGTRFPAPEVVERDFAAMADAGFNAVRTYSVAPRWLLDRADAAGLCVMVGIPWEHHVAFLRDERQARSIEERVRAGVRACAGHPALLCYAVGNEIPSAIVRWHGARRVERFLERLCRAAREEDPDGLVTYVSFPPTEYLRLPFVDLLCFNVYLEQRESLSAYLARLQVIAGDRPLVMAEIGLDSRRHGEAEQARALHWQVETAFASGCAGAFVFGWTDEWYVSYLSPEGDAHGGTAIDDWDFGLTDRARRPKLALEAVRRTLSAVPFGPGQRWPRVSVVICTYNGARTLRFCLDGVSRLDYPDYEVIVVDDGSTDASATIAGEYDVSIIRTENGGLSRARNIGAQAATGEIIAYIDDDACPDPDWLRYVVATLESTDHAAVGGPNVPPPSARFWDTCMAGAPGGPICVLTSDSEAEHVPGCNLAVRHDALTAIGGFDPRFRVAGDDVDVCWRLQDRGMSIGFSPAALVWHQRRGSLRAYWRQQRGYGKAEALLERKWPARFNAAGQARWSGRIYGRGTPAILGRPRVYSGTWGSRLFQSLYEPAAASWWSLVLMPEWYLLIAGLLALTCAGLLWTPLFAAGVPLIAAAGLSLAEGFVSARRSPAAQAGRWGIAELAVTTLLFLIQPLARLAGRVRHGLTVWRRCGPAGFRVPRTREVALWHERWIASEDRLRTLEGELRAQAARVVAGGPFDSWDLAVSGGLLGGARLRTAVEEHGAGRQLVRARCWPVWSGAATVASLALGAATVGAALSRAWAAAILLGLIVATVVGRAALEGGGAVSTITAEIERRDEWQGSVGRLVSDREGR